MHIKLISLSGSEYPAWFDHQSKSYADDKVQAKQWAKEGAEERARQETQRFLTDGLDTPNHHVCHIIDTNSSQRVGTLWWFLSERFGRKVIFIFDLMIDHEFRRRGYASSALKELERIARDEKADALSLHVFAFNQGAYHLYQKLGYITTSMSMMRELSE